MHDCHWPDNGVNRIPLRIRFDSIVMPGVNDAMHNDASLSLVEGGPPFAPSSASSTNATRGDVTKDLKFPAQIRNPVTLRGAELTLSDPRAGAATGVQVRVDLGATIDFFDRFEDELVVQLPEGAFFAFNDSGGVLRQEVAAGEVVALNNNATLVLVSANAPLLAVPANPMDPEVVAPTPCANEFLLMQDGATPASTSASGSGSGPGSGSASASGSSSASARPAASATTRGSFSLALGEAVSPQNPSWRVPVQELRLSMAAGAAVLANRSFVVSIPDVASDSDFPLNLVRTIRETRVLDCFFPTRSSGGNDGAGGPLFLNLNSDQASNASLTGANNVLFFAVAGGLLVNAPAARAAPIRTLHVQVRNRMVPRRAGKPSQAGRLAGRQEAGREVAEAARKALRQAHAPVPRFRL